LVDTSNGNFTAASYNDNILELEFSQYFFSESGSSACTAIALTALNKILYQLENHLPCTQQILTEALLAGIEKYNNYTAGNQKHLAVDELIPILEDGMSMVGESLEAMLTDDMSFFKMFSSSASGKAK
jgi:hypothetical protein